MTDTTHSLADSPTMEYYVLTMLNSTPYHQQGDKVMNAGQPLDIGQTTPCEVRTANDSPYEDRVLATIVRNTDSTGWHIINRSEGDGIILNGEGVPLAARLADGCRLSVGGAEMRFNIRHDGGYRPDDGVVRQTMRRMPLWKKIAAIVVAVAVLLIAGHAYVSHFDKDSIRGYEQDICLIYVDSVYLEQSINGGAYRCVKAMAPEESAFGTCFFTADGQLVTARHCVEYWVCEPWDIDEESPAEIQTWSTFVETQRARQQDTLWRLTALCSVKDANDSTLLMFRSSDQRCTLDRSHDMIIDMGDGTTHCYWRTLIPAFNNKQMEMGDWVRLDCGIRGRIQLADSAFMYRLRGNEKVVFCGYPKTESSYPTLWKDEGNLQALPPQPDRRF